MIVEKQLSESVKKGMFTNHFNNKTKKSCTDGKRHYWKDGWICEKCGLRKSETI